MIMSFFSRLYCFCSKKKESQNIEWRDTVPFVPPVNTGCVVKVYDGDTITIASKMPYKNSLLYRFSVRLRGIDCPEIKGKTITEKELACNARDALANKLLGKNIILKNVSLEKYGRLLADVYFDGVNMNQWMLDNKLALPYDGGTKYRPTEWDDIDLDKK